MMKLFNSDKKIPKETKLLIFLLFIAVIIFLHLLRSPFFIFAGILFLIYKKQTNDKTIFGIKTNGANEPKVKELISPLVVVIIS